MTDATIPASGRLLSGFQRAVTAALALGGGVLFVVGCVANPHRGWVALLANGFTFLSFGVIGAVFLVIHALAKAGWPVVFRRVPEAMTAWIPIGGVALLAVLLGAGAIYPWMHAADDPILEAKAPWLNLNGLAIRLVVCVVTWTVLSGLLVRGSRRQDVSGDLALTRRNVVVSAIGAILLAATFTVVAIDWLMSLEPHWFSTLYPWYVFAGSLAGGTAVLTLLVLALASRGDLPVNQHHLHDLGKYVFAFSCFWGYLWYSQYMLIWYSNLPEETSHYVLRLSPVWKPWFLVNLFINCAAPFLLLLPAAWKKSRRLLALACIIVAFGHWIDVLLLVVPAVYPEGPLLGMAEVGGGVGFAGLFVWVVDAALRRAPRVPLKDPYYAESLHHHVL